MGDRRRATHSIEVPMTQTPSHNSRKRPPSDTYDDQFKGDELTDCNAALILMNLSNSPNTVSEKWMSSSPGSSSSASWSSGSASPPLSDDGNALHGHIILSPHDPHATASANARIRTTSVSTSDEGIVIDFKEERKKKPQRFRCTFPGCTVVELTQHTIERHVRDIHNCNRHEEEFYYDIDEDDDELVKTPSPASPPTLSHRDMARPPHEDPEYQRQIVGNFQQGRAMNNYHHQTHQQQQQHHISSSSSGHSNHNSGSGHGSGHITSTQQQQLQNNNTSCIPTSPPTHHNYAWASNAAISVTASSTSHQAHHSGSNTATLNKHARSSSSRPSHSTAPYPSPTYVHHHNISNNNNNNNSSSIGSSSSNSSSNCSSSNSSPVIHSNSSANNMLQQLSQQNVTVTAHHSAGSQQQQHQHQQQHHLSSVTITPNYQPPQSQQQQQQQQTHHHQQQQQQQQQHLRGQQQPTASNNIVANSGQHMSLQHVAVQQTVSAAKHTPNSPNRRTRGENKKCRKVYGMDRRDQWCTQCKWKKACTRFGD